MKWARGIVWGMLLVSPLAWGQPPVAPVPHAEAQACITCHVSDVPTAADAALKGCQRHLVQDPDSNEVADAFLLDQLSDIYVGVLFPHKLHAQMAEMGGGCASCHHHNPPGRILACNECHGGPSNPNNLRQPGLRGAYHRQCLACHREWSHESKCSTCHAKREAGVVASLPADPTDIIGLLHPTIESPKVKVYESKDEMLAEMPYVTFHHEEHVQLFGQKCVTCHEKESCSSCHDSTIPRKPHIKTEPHQDCMRCHQERIDTDCASCHQPQPTEGFSHMRRTSFDLAPYHTDVACTACHKEAGVFTGLQADCTACHAADWVPETFDHARTGTPLDPVHQLVGCIDCHNEGILKPASCTACHDDGRTSF